MNSEAENINVVRLSRDCVCVNDKYVIKSIDRDEWLPEEKLTTEEWKALHNFLHKPKR